VESKKMSEEKVLELNQEDLVKGVADAIKGEVVDAVKGSVSDAVKAAVIEATEKTVEKDVEDKDQDANKGTDDKVATGLAAETKEVRFAKACKALASGNMDVVREYNAITSELREKSGYGNITTDADGAYLVPDPDFDATVESLNDVYGVAFKYADVRQISGNAVKLNRKASGFDFTEVGEKGSTPGVKLTIGQVTADLRKFRAIAPITEELDQDSAVNYWDEVANEFARARAKKADEIVFTDATSGLLNLAGTEAQTVGAANTDLDWDDVMNAEDKVVDEANENAVWFMNKTVWTRLRQLKDGEDRYLFNPNPSAPTTPWGTTVVPVSIMPKYANVGSNEAFAVYGDLKHYKLYVKRGLEIEMLREATVKDEDGNDFNLALEGGRAMLGWTRMLGVARHANAFCLLGTGTVS
jgi:HK97 family phage major capsid protein